jgi:hypothetical protein
LTTLSTVVAVATGMFSLRDEILPQQAPEADASVSLYEQSIGDVCRAVNEAETARGRNDRRLAKRLRQGNLSAFAQRDALLDSTRMIVENSEHALAAFNGLDAPPALRAREHQTTVAWDHIVAQLRGYMRRLEVVGTREDLSATLKTLPAMRIQLAADRLDRASGLTRLGGGRCTLDPPIATMTISLPRRPARAVSGARPANHRPTGGAGRDRSGARSGAGATPPPPPPVNTVGSGGSGAGATPPRPRPPVNIDGSPGPGAAATPPPPPPPVNTYGGGG